MMKVWGILSPQVEASGFEVVLDEGGYLLLQREGQNLARFDPLQYTMPDVRREVEKHIWAALI
ncbi:MAG: hypothetical protein PHV74_04490 [Dehalococcoidia bacterium]|nr:hypothetical protein [Dehalococcoidia bacterium]